MDRQLAAQCLIAAKHDPRLAAWVSIIHQHNLSPTADVGFGDHQQALEDLLARGLISLRDYDSTRSYRPCNNDVQGALMALQNLTAQEIAMEDSRSLSRQNVAIATNPDDAWALDESPGTELDSFDAGPEPEQLAPFDEPPPPALPFDEPAFDEGLEAPPPPRQITPRNGGDNRLNPLDQEIQCLVRGCMATVKLIHQDSDVANGLEGHADSVLHEYLVRGKCRSCHAEHMIGVYTGHGDNM